MNTSKDSQNDSLETSSPSIEPIETTVVGSIEDKPLKKRGRGRPRKSEIAAKKKPGKPGRPPGEAAAIADFKARLLASPKSRKVFDTILDAALDDEHKNQSAAWKLLMDRLLPVSYFEKEKDGSGRAAVNITISGVGGEEITIGSAETNSTNDDALDGEFYENKD